MRHYLAVLVRDAREMLTDWPKYWNPSSLQPLAEIPDLADAAVRR
jgi:hypothetical protein